MTFPNSGRVSGIFIVACAWLLPVAHPAPAWAQQSATPPELEEIVVIGSRRDPRTVLQSAAPVDVLSAEDLQRQGSTDMDDMLRTLHPSYNVQRHSIDDEATMVRPATLRGLPPDSAMLLLNGKRRHRTSAIALLGGSSLIVGSQGPDLSVIPSIALRQVELLRDGASAQYGADAIAGVLNFQLREDSEGTDLEARIGEYIHEHDGELLHLAGNFGFELTRSGFFNLSLEYRDTADTVRSGTREAARRSTQLGYPVKDPAQIWGSPEVRDWLTAFFNSGLELTPDLSAYAFGGLHQREAEGSFFLRAPATTEARSAFFATSRPGAPGQPAPYEIEDPENSGTYFRRLVVPRLVLDAEGAPVLGMDGNPTTQGGATTESCQLGPDGISDTDDDLPTLDSHFDDVQRYIEDNPNCFLFNERFPGGTTPRFGAEMEDWSIVLGLKGETFGDLRWDFSVGAARSEMSIFMKTTFNASLGPDTPTSFKPRGYTQEELSANLDFVKPLEVGGFASPLNIAFGLEWREETFTSIGGDEASWVRGPYSRYGYSVGSNGYQGLDPKNAGEWDRPNWAAYIDLEADVTERLLVGVAARYEDFYDDFGDTLKGKLALSYEVVPGLHLRSTVSTGFRAPSPGQSNLSVLSTDFAGGGDLLVEVGQLPPTAPISAALGGEPLTEEESVNYSGGLAWRIGDRLTFTLDYFRIEVEDRVSLTGDIDLGVLQLRNCNHGPEGSTIVEFEECDAAAAHATEPVISASTAADEAFGATVSRVRFYSNDFDTTTQGMDLVLAWSPDWSIETDIELAWNWTETEVGSSSSKTINCFPRENGGCDPLVGENQGTEMDPDYENTPQPIALLSTRRRNELEDLNPEQRIVLTSRHRLDDLGLMLRMSHYSGWKSCRYQDAECPIYDSYSGAWIFDLEFGYDIDERMHVALGVSNLFDEFPDVPLEETERRGNLRPISTPWDYNGTFGYVRFTASF